MSGNIYIAPTNRKKKFLSKDLKYILEKKMKFPFKIDESNISYFQALRDANIEGAEEVILFIDKYGECEITIEY